MKFYILNSLFRFSSSSLCLMICGFCLLAGCASVPQRSKNADLIAKNAGMQKREVDTGNFILTTYYKIKNKNEPVTVYIEGDGFAWASRSRVSVNPTPKDAFTLQLAAVDTSPNVVYIARPCQYTSLYKDKLCGPKYWAGSRFSEIVIDSVNKAISNYAKMFPNPKINLVGYSGGASVAVLVATRRNDIVTLRTVAGNLDHVAINKFHKVNSMDDSLNPIDVSEKLASLPQYHFVGEKDAVIPIAVIRSFAAKADRGTGCILVSSVDGATHNAGWKEKWRELLARPIRCPAHANKL